MRSFVLSILVTIPLPRVWACSCALSPAGNPPCQAAWEASAVFTGTVVDITGPTPALPTPPPQANGRAAARRTPDIAPQAPDFPKLEVRLRVREVLGGIDSESKEISILTGRGGGDCGYPFRVGEEYAVYAYRNPRGLLETGICSRTRPIADADEDVAYIRSIARAPATGDIQIATGLLNRPGVAGVHTTVEGVGSRYTAVTGTDGTARFPALAPGEYKISGELDGYFPFERMIKLHAKGCAAVALIMALDRRITGRVFTKDGLPAPDVEVQVRRPQDRSGDRAKTDANGRYELRHFSAGAYYLGFNITGKASIESPYTTWFYPGTTDAGKAAFIVFADAPQTQNIDLVLPERQHGRAITGTVWWPNGQPAAAAAIQVLDSGWLWQGAAGQTTTDEQGRFTLRVLDGTAYRLHAVGRRQATGGVLSADPVAIQPGSNPLDLGVVLTRSGNSVLDDQRKGFEQLRNRP